MSGSGSDQGTVISSNQWPHEQLTHLAVHTPVQAHRTVEDSSVEFPTPASHNFPQHNSAPYPNYPQELIRQYSEAGHQVNTSPPVVVTSAFGTTSPTAFNNNNTKLHDNEIVEQSENNLQTPIKHELNGNNPVESLNNNGWESLNEDSRSENNDLHSKTPNNHHSHQILSPVPLQSSRLSWLAESKPEIAQPLPLKPEICQNELNGDMNMEVNGEETVNNGDYNSQSTSNENSNGAERRTTLNEEETARLLLTLSQNFVNQSNNDSNQIEAMTNINDPMISPSSNSTPNGQRNNNSNQRSRTFFRPPGHRGTSAGPTADGTGLICEVCGFGCSSRFHYNSHMNTHGCHQCSICNYRSRTEGRLKKHMQDSHTAEQRREFADSQSDPSAPNEITNMDPPQIDNQSQRLPGTLEQIRALADNSIGFNTTDQPTGSGLSSDISQSTIKRSGGKPKKYSCKQCGEVTTTKEASWRHNKTHIPPEKQLACTECDFVTEYKHHLQYHLRNHIGSKPFKCSKCEYTCVNKSMLNSHMKSHTPVYQFRCQDCTYQTKYCHSLKMHTYKYNHRRVQGQVYTVGDENGESLDECIEETESMKNYDIPDDDLEAIERHKRQERERMQAETNQFQAENGSSSQLALINQQPVSTPRLSSLLLQPIVTNSAANNQLQQFLLQQQRIGQVQQMINANAYHLPRQKCELCEFSTTSHEELLKHKIGHYIPNQQQQAQLNALHLYNQQLSQHNSLSLQQPSNFLDLATQLRNHSIQQQHANQIAISKANELALESSKTDGRGHNETPDPSGATTTTTASTPRVVGEAFAEEHESGSSELHDEAGETSSSPSDSHKSMDAASSSPHSSSSAPHTGAKKRKAMKLDKISQRLQDKCSPDNADDRMSPNEKIQKPNENGNIAQPIPSIAPLNGLTNGSPHQLNSIIAQFSANIQEHRHSPMPYTCQHCMIAFNDQALYQIHLGYHGYDTPFKCNRCGHHANSALNFNLHLYQEKH